MDDVSECLPAGWKRVSLEGVVEFLDNRRVPVNDEERKRRIAGKSPSELFPYYGANGQVGWIDDYLFSEPLILLAEDGGFFEKIGRVAYRVDGKTWVNNHAHVLRPVPSINFGYVLHALNAQNLMPFVSGTTRLKLNQSNARKIPIPLAPERQQKLIVSKIEQLFAEIKIARREIAKISEIARKFRQSILSKAFRGELIERNPNDEPAQKLVQRIKQDHRRTWEDELRARGKDPKRYTYNEFETTKIEGLPELPQTWTWTQIGAVGEVVTGKTPPTSNKQFYGRAVPFVKPGDLDTRGLITDSMQFLSKEGAQYVRPIPAYSVMVTSIGATIGKTGISGKTVVTNQQINSIVLPQLIDPFFVYYYCVSDFFQNQVRANASSTTLPILNKTRFEHLPLPVAPTSEQEAISVRVKQTFARCEEIENAVAISTERLDRLEESILFNAFKGELVSHYSSDEPA